MSKLRVLLVPITRRCYALHANIFYKSSTSVNLSDVSGHHSPTHLTLNQIPILKNIKSQRIRNAIDKNLSELHVFWTECEEKSESDPKHWKGRLYLYSESLLQRIDGYETFLGHIPYKRLMRSNEDTKTIKLTKKEPIEHLSYIIPNGMDEKDATNHLKAISKRKIKYHQKWFYLNVCLLPFTALLGLLPGPNIFILYNGFRCYGHYKAYHGAIAIDHRKSDFNVVTDQYLGEIYKDLENDIKQEIDDESLHALQTKLECQHIFHHLHRIRYQVVELERYQQYELIA